MKTFSLPPLALAASVCGLAAVFVAGCSEAPPPANPPKVVRSLIVGDASGAHADSRAYGGEVRARRETALAFRLNGKIAERLVDAGAVVKAGQPLAHLDPADAALQLQQADAQRQLAESDLKRYRDLQAKGFVSASALDSKETAFRAAAAQAGLAKNQSAYTVLTADRAGTIAAVQAEAGQVVTAGQAVFRLAPDGEREVAITLPESDIGKFKVGQAAEVTLWAQEGQPVRGVLREIANGADPATRTYAARVSLPDVPARLPVGMSAVVRFPQAGAAELVVPLSAIFQQGDKSAVWVVDAKQALELRSVTVRRYADNGAVLADGVSKGERIVAAGVHKLVAGETVRLAEQPVTPAPAPAAAASAPASK